MNSPKGLCYRCEHRARFLEEGIRPRFECGEIEKSVNSCYMYQPIKPVVLEKQKGDKRPQFGSWMISARSSGVRIPELKLETKKYKDGNLIYWIPKAIGEDI